MIENVLSSPPVALVLFLALAYGLYCLGGRLAAPGEEHPGKHQPYASGEDLLPQATQLTYHSFFRLALIFGMLHLATLVVSTVPPGGSAHLVAFAYLTGIAISVFVLTQGEP